MAFRTPVLFAVVAFMAAAGCKRDEPSGFPAPLVDISININNPAYADLAVPGGWLYLTGGSLGIIVYRSGPAEFVALDRHCRYQPADLCRVWVDDTQVVARDTACCGSAYLITDGSVVQGPAAMGLLRYNTSFNGTVLRIYN
jgi:nitrite reductase/ring-hydroxylating ferredoxin subunit